jgi:hypothetical protein
MVPGDIGDDPDFSWGETGGGIVHYQIVRALVVRLLTTAPSDVMQKSRVEEEVSSVISQPMQPLRRIEQLYRKFRHMLGMCKIMLVLSGNLFDGFDGVWQ